MEKTDSVGRLHKVFMGGGVIVWRAACSGEEEGFFFRVELTVECVREPNLPPSAVRVGDVTLQRLLVFSFSSFSLCLSPLLFAANVMLSAHICLSAVGAGGLWSET